jgi:hypothetical protein
MSSAQAYPLRWPTGWKRTAARARKVDRFSSKGPTFGNRALTNSEAASRVLLQLERFGVDIDQVIISSNVRPTLGGLPRSGERNPEDPGVAVYWTKRGEPQRCMAIDCYSNVAGNLAAIAATLEAMRAIERHGGAAILDRAFAGFAALPPSREGLPWVVLGVEPDASEEDVERAYRALAMKFHPDRGGTEADMARLNAARRAMFP